VSADRDHHSSSRGFALLVVLWFLVLIAAVGTYLMANARSQTALAHNMVVRAKAEALADAGIAQAVFNLTDPVVDKRWPLDGQPHQMALLGGTVVVKLADESLKINPNIASEFTMAGLFQAVGVDASTARHLGAAVADWVNGGDKPRPFGAKKEDYLNAGRNYGPPNAPMQSLDEMQLVLGMTPAIFAAVQPYLTIYTEADAPDPTVAPTLIRRALDIAASLAADDNAAVNSAAGQPNQAQAPAAQDADQPVIADAIVTASLPGGGVFVRRAILQIDATDPKGYIVRDWRRIDASN